MMGYSEQDYDYEGETMPGAVRPTEQYTAEHYQHKASMTHVEAHEYLMRFIDRRAFLTLRAQRAYRTMVTGLFDPTNVLSVLDDTELAEIEMEIELAKAQRACRKSDRQNPLMMVLEQDIRRLYSLFLTRAVKGKERGFQGSDEIRQSSTSRIEHIAPMQQQKRGILGGLGRGKEGNN